MKRESFLL